MGENKCLRCTANEYLSGNKCLKCDPNCLECSKENPGMCNVCMKDFVIQDDGSCNEKVEVICQANQFIKDDTCVDCAENCLECVNL